MNVNTHECPGTAGHECLFGGVTPNILYLQIQLYDTFSLLRVHWILCYRIKNIYFMVFIKQLKPKILCSVIVAIQTGALPSKVRVVGSNSLPGTGSFFFLSFPPLLSFLSLHCASTQLYARCGQGPER